MYSMRRVGPVCHEVTRRLSRGRANDRRRAAPGCSPPKLAIPTVTERMQALAILSPGDGAVYDPASGVWLNLPRGLVKALDNASVAWTGRQFLVWDGGDTYTRGAPTGEELTPSHS
jgi:hypothetical protein